ncbi:MAG: DUF2239 family protein [Terracidiphilus sp.]|jgi:hypothetical protein
MIQDSPATFSAFAGTRLIACGDLRPVAFKAQVSSTLEEHVPVLIFDDRSGEVIEINLRATPAEFSRQVEELERAGSLRAGPAGAGPAGAGPARAEALLPGEGPRGPGRPRLGVVAREVTLLPRHWDWLASQPGGASVALRKLVEGARRTNQETDRLRLAKEAAYRFMSTMAGNEPGFEEAARALFAGDEERFVKFAEAWPVDVATHALRLAAPAWAARPASISPRTPDGLRSGDCSQ